jgi:hypothetical protein
MAKGRQRAEWERTAQLSALLANPYRDQEEHPEPFEPWEFNPMADERPKKLKKPAVKMRVSCLKWLCDNGVETPEQQPTADES